MPGGVPESKRCPPIRFTDLFAALVRLSFSPAMQLAPGSCFSCLSWFPFFPVGPVVLATPSEHAFVAL